MADVKYEDEKLLTSDEFIKTAKENADKNLQIQKDTAQKVLDSTYASLERQYDETATAAGVAKQRNLIDADTEYQRQELKYGAEQEALAAAGLSGSGMNEYRRAQSYQQNREDRQMSYAEYDRALREAAYTRDQGKLAADINKMQADANADILYNDTMTSISEKELGYADLERQEIDTAYGGYLAGIEDGSLTMAQIKADASWTKLSPDQQASVEKTAKIKGIKTKIDNGEIWEDIQGSYAYLELDEDGRNQVDGYHAQVVAGKTKDANAALGSYLEMAMTGMSIDSIKAVAEANGHYSVLSESDAWKSVVAETEAYADNKKTEENEANFSNWLKGISDGSYTLADVQAMSGYDKLSNPQKEQLLAASDKITADAKNDETVTNIENAIADGATLEEIQGMEGYDVLDDTTKANIEQAVKDRDNETQTRKEQISAGLRLEGYTSVNDVEDYLVSEGVPAAERAEYIAQWQGEMANRTIASINDGSAFNGENALTGAALAENIKNGVYGDQGEQVATEFITFMLSVLQDPDADINDATEVRNMISGLKDYVSDDLWTKASVALGHKNTWWKYSEEAVFEGVPVKLGNEIIDSRTLSSLERYKSKHTKNQVITFNGNMYYRDGDKWWALEKDTSRPTGLITVDWISNSEYKLETGVKWSYNGDKKIALKDSESEALNNMFPDSTTGNVATINGVRYGKDGSGKWWRIK